MLKTHKIALNPNNVQATEFAQHCGYARVAYNHVLADFKDGLTNGEWRSHIELNKRFNAVKREQYDMLKNHRCRSEHPRFAGLAKALSDASLSSFLSMLIYKSERLGVKIVEADTFYPSSQTCSACGAKDKDLSLSDRTYHCSDCGHTQDRDLNAAINLRTVAVGHTET